MPFSTGTPPSSTSNFATFASITTSTGGGPSVTVELPEPEPSWVVVRSEPTPDPLATTAEPDPAEAAEPAEPSSGCFAEPEPEPSATSAEPEPVEREPLPGPLSLLFITTNAAMPPPASNTTRIAMMRPVLLFLPTVTTDADG